MIRRLAALAMCRARHQVLIFHRVFDRPDPMHPSEPSAEWFRALVRMLATDFELLSLSAAVQRAGEGRLSGRSLSITFDDGYADNATVATPILAEFNAPATFFVASGFLDGGRMWNDSIIETVRRLDQGRHTIDGPSPIVFELSDWESRRRAAESIITAWKHLPLADRQANVDRLATRVAELPSELMMSSDQLRAMAHTPGVTIGGHTRNHPILAKLDAAEARSEIEDGKRDIEGLVQQEVTLFAYPNGKQVADYHVEHADLVRQAGFQAAVATDWGTLDAQTDRFTIPRFTPWHKNLARFSIDLARCHHGLIEAG